MVEQPQKKPKTLESDDHNDKGERLAKLMGRQISEDPFKQWSSEAKRKEPALHAALDAGRSLRNTALKRLRYDSNDPVEIRQNVAKIETETLRNMMNIKLSSPGGVSTSSTGHDTAIVSVSREDLQNLMEASARKGAQDALTASGQVGTQLMLDNSPANAGPTVEELCEKLQPGFEWDHNDTMRANLESFGDACAEAACKEACSDVATCYGLAPCKFDFKWDDSMGLKENLSVFGETYMYASLNERCHGRLVGVPCFKWDQDKLLSDDLSDFAAAACTKAIKKLGLKAFKWDQTEVLEDNLRNFGDVYVKAECTKAAKYLGLKDFEWDQTEDSENNLLNFGGVYVEAEYTKAAKNLGLKDFEWDQTKDLKANLRDFGEEYVEAECTKAAKDLGLNDFEWNHNALKANLRDFGDEHAWAECKKIVEGLGSDWKDDIDLDENLARFVPKETSV